MKNKFETKEEFDGFLKRFGEVIRNYHSRQVLKLGSIQIFLILYFLTVKRYAAVLNIIEIAKVHFC